MLFTEEDELNFNNSKTCWICEEIFPEKASARGNEVDDKNKEKTKCRDHCHFSGKYCGVAHSECNLKLREKVHSSLVS